MLFCACWIISLQNLLFFYLVEVVNHFEVINCAFLKKTFGFMHIPPITIIHYCRIIQKFVWCQTVHHLCLCMTPCIYLQCDMISRHMTDWFVTASVVTLVFRNVKERVNKSSWIRLRSDTSSLAPSMGPDWTCFSFLLANQNLQGRQDERRSYFAWIITCDCYMVVTLAEHSRTVSLKKKKIWQCLKSRQPLKNQLWGQCIPETN